MQLILASSSPFRKKVLEKLQLPFIQISPDIDEMAGKNEQPQYLVERLAKKKAEVIAQSNRNSLIIASDQIAVCEGRIFGKPGDHQSAIEQLLFTGGKKVNFFTSLVLLNSQTLKLQSHIDVTEVSFRALTIEQIEVYLKTDKPYNCAGSFKSEAFGASLFSKIVSEDPDALIGLPLLKLVSMLAEENMDPLKQA